MVNFFPVSAPAHLRIYSSRFNFFRVCKLDYKILLKHVYVESKILLELFINKISLQPYTPCIFEEAATTTAENRAIHKRGRYPVLNERSKPLLLVHQICKEKEEKNEALFLTIFLVFLYLCC